MSPSSVLDPYPPTSSPTILLYNPKAHAYHTFPIAIQHLLALLDTALFCLLPFYAIGVTWSWPGAPGQSVADVLGTVVASFCGAINLTILLAYLCTLVMLLMVSWRWKRIGRVGGDELLTHIC
jgi:hypothetical protein